MTWRFGFGMKSSDSAVKVTSSQGTYPIHFVEKSEVLRDLPASSYILTDTTVREHFSLDLPHYAIQAGEGSKSIEVYAECVSWLAEQRASRKSTIVALGGGVVGDLAGFVAATYMRGVRFLQIPTTLLAQVDSSVGGKVGVDLPEGKNLVGAFQPPMEVRIATDALASLPTRHFQNGMAEVLKYGLIMDAALHDALATDVLLPESASLSAVVRRCVELKAQVVQEDEFETTGLRAILNFGHTVGHAIEKVLRYEELLHGEAISIGMVVEARLGEQLGITPKGTTEVVRAQMQRYGLPVRHDVLNQSAELVEAMKRDKKATDGQLAFSLLTGIGQCKLVSGVEEAHVLRSLEEF